MTFKVSVPPLTNEFYQLRWVNQQSRTRAYFKVYFSWIMPNNHHCII